MNFFGVSWLRLFPWAVLFTVTAFAQPGGQSFLGVGVAEVDQNRARDLKLNEVHGVEITRVEDNSAAAKAGLKTGDVVLEYNGQRVEGIEQFVRLVRETPGGREVKLLIARNGITQTIPVIMGNRNGVAMPGPNAQWFEMPDVRIPAFPQMFPAFGGAALGIEAESLGPQLAAYFGVKSGVLVRSVAPGSAAERAGIKAGDVITRVDRTPVTSPGEVSAAIRASQAKTSFPIELVRDHRETTLTVALDDHHSGRDLPRPN